MEQLDGVGQMDLPQAVEEEQQEDNAEKNHGIPDGQGLQAQREGCLGPQDIYHPQLRQLGKHNAGKQAHGQSNHRDNQGLPKTGRVPRFHFPMPKML